MPVSIQPLVRFEQSTPSSSWRSPLAGVLRLIGPQVRTDPAAKFLLYKSSALPGLSLVNFLSNFMSLVHGLCFLSFSFASFFFPAHSNAFAFLVSFFSPSTL